MTTYKTCVSYVCTMLLVLSGCAGNAHLTKSEPLTITPSDYKVAYLLVDGENGMSTKHGYDNVRDDIEENLLEKLNQQGMFEQVLLLRDAQPHAKDLKIIVTILELNYVSRGGRIGGGIIAGSAHLKVRIVLSDIKTNQNVGKMISWATSSHKHGIFGTVSSSQVEAIVNKIVQELS